MHKFTNKKFYKIFYVIFLIVFFIDVVFAKDTNGCYGILGSINDKTSSAYFLQQIYNVMKFGAPLLTIVLTIMDFIKAVSSQDNDQLKKSAKRAIIRVALCLVLFIIPVLINFLFPLFGWNGTCDIG